MTELIAIGKIVKPSGLQGDVSVVPLTHSVERFRSLHSVYVGKRAAETSCIAVSEVRTHRTAVVMRLAGVDSREQAEHLRNEFVFVTREDVAPAGSGSYLVADLEGLDVVTEAGDKIGVVRDVIEMPAQDLWVVWDGTREWHIPGVEEFIREVNLAKRKVIVRLIEGMGP